MSDNIVEITENTNYSITIDTSLVQNDNNVVIELSSPNFIDIINNATVLISDLPQGYPLSWTTGNLPISRVSGLDIVGSDYINITNNSGIYTVSSVGLQPSGNYSLSGHNHVSSDITNFSSSVSGILPVKDIGAGNGIGINNNNGTYTIAVTGTFGLTGEQVDDRVSNLLIAGDYTNLNYNDNNNQLTISVTGLQPSGNYSVVGHTHVVTDVSGLQNILDNKQPSGIYASGIHYHDSVDITNFDSAVDSRISLANLQPSGNYSVVGHTHTSSNITDFNSSVSGLLPVKNISSGGGISVTNNSGDFTVAVTGNFGLTGEQVDDRVSNLLVGFNYITLNYDDNLDKLTIGTSGLQPSGNYSIVGHNHIISDVSGLQNALDNKQPSGSYSPLIHSHTSNDITDFSSSVNTLVSGIYAPLNNPSFGGIPTAPTASSGTNNTQIANTSFVRNEISNLVNSAPSTLDTLNELATALGNDPNFATTIASGLAGKASLVHSHTSSDIINFNSSVSGLLPITNITGSSGIVVSNSGTTYNIASSGLAFTSGANFNSLSVSGIPVSISGHNHSYTDITNWASGIENEVSTLLVAGNYINLNYDNIADTLTISASGLQPSGNYANSVHSHGNISSSGTIGSTSGLLVTTTSDGTLTTSSGINSSYITNFNSSVSGLLPSVSGSGYVSSNFVNNIYSISVTGLQPSGNYSLSGHAHTSSNITDFNSSVSGLLPVKDINGSGYINISNSSGNYTISVSGLQPSGNYSLNDHTHTSSQITDFSSSVSGLLPTISNSGNNRILTSTGSNVGIAAESNLTFDGSLLSTMGSGYFASGLYVDSFNNINIGDINYASLVIESGLLTIRDAGNLVLATDELCLYADYGASRSVSWGDRVLWAGSGDNETKNLDWSVPGKITINYGDPIPVEYTLDVNGSGNFTDSLFVSGIPVSVSGHSHTSSDITNFNSAVSGLIPVKHIVSGTDISVTSVSGIYTINSTVNTVAESASLITTVFNKTGSPIPKMTAVYIDGGQGDTPTVALAIATGDPTSAGTYGLTFETIPNMSTGKVVVFGGLTGLNTDQFNPTAPHGDVNGQVIYLSPTTPGGLTLTKPSAPNHMVAIGTIVRTHQNQGVIEVRVQNGFELDELHNVAISGVTSGQFLQYNGSGLWIPSSSGNFSALQINNINVSTSGHSHTSSDITDFVSSVSNLLPTISNSGNYRILTSTGSNTGINAESNLTFDGTTLGINTNNIADVALSISGNSPILSIAGGSVPFISIQGTEGSVLYFNGNNGDASIVCSNSYNPTIPGAVFEALEIVSNSGILIDAGNNILFRSPNVPQWLNTSIPAVIPISISGHAHTSSDITNFNSSVSGLLPVTNITGGSNITVSQSGTVYTVAVTGSLGLTTEEVDDRVSNLLVAGSGISLNYNDSGNSLTITATLDVGTTAGTVAAGDHTHAQLHDRSHAITSTSDHTATNWRLFHSNGSGQVVELAFGNSGQALISQGASAAPTWGQAGSTNASDLTTGTLAYARMADPTVTSPSQIAANQNNYASFARGINRFTTDAARDITGMAAGADGEIRVLCNIGTTAANTLTIKDESSSSTAANRFSVPWNGDCVIPAEGSVVVFYDGASQRWRVV